MQGAMPEDASFSRRTWIAAVEFLEQHWRGHSGVTRAMLKISAELSERCESGSLEDRFNSLIKYIDEDPARLLADGALLVEALVQLAVAALPTNEWDEVPDYTPKQAIFLRALDLDGFVLDKAALRRALPVELQLPQAQDDLTQLLAKHGFATLQGHLDQALDAHGRGEWASANAQLRTFYEGLLDQIAIVLEPTSAALPSSENRRSRLGKIGFLDVSLNEWSDDGKNFINGLFKRLHPAGSHPGLSDQTDATFRRHVVLLTAVLLVRRFDEWSRRGTALPA